MSFLNKGQPDPCVVPKVWLCNFIITPVVLDPRMFYENVKSS